ncbi:hypothetical protein GCM10009839_67090 [Catenulispora yoronensis]|uniref:Uncharacterized protein n=1 Tax=Catenulispora yoronensis TaxID=450799 RepID=A0ABN2V3Y1_9ACTN
MLSASTAAVSDLPSSPGFAVAAIPAFFNAALTSKPKGHGSAGAAITLSAAFCSLSTEIFESELPQAARAVLATVKVTIPVMPPGIFTPAP